jgi:ATP-dependent helicase/nuclease subunit B
VTETKYLNPHARAIGDIDKIDAMLGLPAPELLRGHPVMGLWLHPQMGLLARLRAEMEQRGAHPAHTVVVLPYAQLLPLAARLWTQCFPDGFAPRFETTMNWSAALGGARHGPMDITFDMALDTLTAQAMLARAGLGAQQDALGGLLVQAAQQLGPLAAAHAPADRAAWAQAARSHVVLGMDGPALAWEAAVARIAVEWAAVSAYASDVLFSEPVRNSLDCLLMVQGLAADPLSTGLQAFWGSKLACLPLASASEDALATEVHSTMALHACLDAEDEAQRSAACALRHIEAGRIPLALVSSDRALTRRVRAMLEGAGVQIRDENGWKLSTSSAAAKAMAVLRAATWNASTDAVLDWLKSAPAFATQVDALEAAVRRDQVRDWRHVASTSALHKLPDVVAACSRIEEIRDAFKGSKKLASWLAELRSALQASGLWDGLQLDGAGAKVLAVLRLVQQDAPAWDALLEQALWATRRMDLAEFTAWVNQALEGASFQPLYPEREQVVILPMSQMLARPFAAVVLAGCDEVRLSPSPEPSGGWTPAQRAALGLPSREASEALVRAAWQQTLQTPVCDVLWRTSDDAGETLLPSTLVQLLQLGLELDAASTVDPRLERAVPLAPVLPPLPTGELLPVQQLSASAYEDLRNCPYRFFALRQLGLKPVDELDSEVDKRDFGLWLHEVLKRFHEAMAAQPEPERTARRQLLDAASAATTASMALPEGEFLPFAAAWPAVREGYLDWLVKHEATGAVFTSAEVALTQRLGDLKLVGRIDRIDTLPDGSVLVVDYKTEPTAKTSARVKEPLEDTQIAFYAALLSHDTLQGAYVNVGEREATKPYLQPHVVEARDALVEGILHDMAHIAQGAALPALGDGTVCDFCNARGMCRKDFWK